MRPVPDDHVVLADARDLDPAEHDAPQASEVTRWPLDPGASLSRIEECLAEIVLAVEPVAAYIACARTPQRIGD